VIPQWPEGTAAVLSTAGPHAIPVSTAVRTSDATVHLALGPRRGSLARLRGDPRAVLTVMAAGAAFTLHGRVSEDGEAEGTVVLRLDVDEDPDLVELIRQARSVCIEALDRQELPFEDVLESLRRRHSEEELKRPLFEAMLVMQDELTGIDVGEALTLTPYRSERNVLATSIAPTTSEVILGATSGADGIELTLQFRPATLAPAVAQSLLEDVAATLTETAQALRVRA
jgi:hypothetical protein